MTAINDGDNLDDTAAICCAPLLASTIDDGSAEQLATMLKALADPIRLRLVNIIALAGEGCACDFPQALDRSQPTISHHLRVLVDAGILEREQRGKWAWFRVREERLADLTAALGPIAAR